MEAPSTDYRNPYNNEQANDAFETYVDDTFENLPIADAQDIEHAWGPLTTEELDKINHPGYITNDKEHLEASEQKQQAKDKKMKTKEESRKKRPNIAKLQRETRKANRAQKRALTPPPPNQLAQEGDTADGSKSAY
jgi:hypothetical protein